MGVQSSKISQDGLYTILGVSEDCTDSELKKAYYKKALELHPDRNAHRIEEATKLFAKLQAAYDLLTNPDERKWYDTQSKNPKYGNYNSHLTSAEEVRSLTFQVLQSKSFSFAKIQTYFEVLKQEEQEAAFQQGIDPPFKLIESPVFGSKTDSWQQVSKFYDAWTSFNTVKDFAWEDMFPVHAAPDRKTRRKFEQQNKKLRDASKREFNAAVNQAVTQLRQIDPRKPKKQTKPKPAKPPQSRAQSHAHTHAGTRTGDLQYTPQEWQVPEESETTMEKMDCIVCETEFDNIFDLDQHKLTSKHKKKLAEFKQRMLEEDELMGNFASLDLNKENQSQNENVDVKPGKAKTKAKKKRAAQQQMLTCSTCGVEMLSDALMEHRKITRHS